MSSLDGQEMNRGRCQCIDLNHLKPVIAFKNALLLNVAEKSHIGTEWELKADNQVIGKWSYLVAFFCITMF